MANLDQLYQTAMDAFQKTNQGGITNLPTETQTSSAFPDPSAPTDQFGNTIGWNPPPINLFPSQPPGYQPPGVKPDRRIFNHITDNPYAAGPPDDFITIEGVKYNVPPVSQNKHALLDEEQADFKDGKKSPMSVIPDEYGDFFNSQFYNPGAPGLAVMTPVTLPSGETITFPDSSSANQFRQYLNSLEDGGLGIHHTYTPPTGDQGGMWNVPMNEGGIVSLDYLTRRL